MLLKLSNWLVSSSLSENTVCAVLVSPKNTITVDLEATNLVLTDLLSKNTIAVNLEANDTVAVELEATNTIEVEVNTLRCEQQIPVRLYALQNSGRIYQFTDVDANLDFSAATVITFDVWETISSGSPQLISEDLTGGVSVIDTNAIQVSLEDGDLSVPTGEYWWELWATIGSDNKLVGRGDFVVRDTRKFD